MGFRAALLRGLAGGGFVGAALRGLEPAFVPPSGPAHASWVSVRLRDYLDQPAIVRAFLVTAPDDTFGALKGAVQGWLAALDGASGAVLEQCDLKVPIPLPDGIKAVPTPDVAIPLSLLLNFANEQDSAAYSFRIPALAYVTIEDGGPSMADSASIDVLADLMEVGLTGTVGGRFTTKRAGPLGSAFLGRLVVRTDQEQMERKSSRAVR